MKKSIFLLILFLVVLTATVFGQSNSVEIWIRAFIPNPQNAGGGAGYVKSLPDGNSYVQVRNAEDPLINWCWHTDNRGFSNNPAATSRLETKFTLTLNQDGTGIVMPEKNPSTAGITSSINCETGSIIAQKVGSMDRDALGAAAAASGTVQVLGQTTSTNLLQPVIGNIPHVEKKGPSIDYSYDIQWTPRTSTLKAAVTVGSFPAFEMYARQPNGKWNTIINQLPTGTPWALMLDSYGINSFRVVESKTVKGIQGNWVSPSPDKRFTLEFNGQKVTWTEQSQSGTRLVKEVSISEISNGKFKIERPNNDEVLTFLGFQPGLRAEILARSPQPSFIIFSTTNDKLIVEWNGLIATKDSNAHLKELIQPGIRPAKIYELSQTP